MESELLNVKLIDSFCKEYQSVWLIDTQKQLMNSFYINKNKNISNTVDLAVVMKTYEESRIWYIDNYVVPYQRSRVTLQTTWERVLDETAKGETYYVEYGKLENGVLSYNQLCYDRIENDEGRLEYIVLGFRNIDVRRKTEIDDVTGVIARRTFFNKAEELLVNNPDEQFDLVISDIVDFKKINETYGVKKADEILRWLGSYLSEMMTDTLLIGRYGGDQMVMIGKHEDIKEKMSDQGINAFLERERSNGLPDIVTKFGIYENVTREKAIVSSCDKAHLALNSIKSHYEIMKAYYDDELKKGIDKQRRIEKSMYESLKNGDFKVFYQPKHDAISGELVGAEALIRWVHPEYGFMPPADFIPLFEKNGFVVENDKFVWRRTCENLKRWQDKGIETVPISINASKLTIADEDLIDNIQSPVKENGISPDKLHVEVTETLRTEDVDSLAKKLTELRNLGYKIELDDFGAGYSSINVLSSLPLDVVKLDMSFMKQFGEKKRGKVLAASIQLAKELGYKTVSEGVEYNEQREILGVLGVDIIQGFLFSKPLPEEEFEKYMMKYQKQCG